jgi:hypothetical protein
MTMYRVHIVIVAATCGIQTFQAQASILVTAEAPGVQASMVPDVATENFDSFAPGRYTTLMTDVGTYSSSVAVVAAGVFGGAGGNGRYMGVGSHSGTAEGSLVFQGGAQAYFGFWWSAADSSNFIDFYLGSTLLGSFEPGSALAALTDPAYFGNPNGGGNSIEKYAYINFVGTGGTTFDRVVFRSSIARGFESDNHSILATQIPVNAIPGDEIGEIPTVQVPEPSSFLMWIMGIVGIHANRRRENREIHDQPRRVKT